MNPRFQSEELATASFLLKIFRACVVKMPKTASNFARDLEKKLLPMINSGTGGGLVSLRHSILLSSFVLPLNH